MYFHRINITAEGVFLEMNIIRPQQWLVSLKNVDIFLHAGISYSGKLFLIVT